jgi:hypothetical protein
MNTPKTPDPASVFKTHDLYFAAYLQTAGVQLMQSERGANGKVAFIFSTGLGNIPELKDAYFNNTGKIQALPYANAIKNLKAVCHMT